MKNTHRISTYLLSVMLLLGIVYAGTERAMPEAGLWKVITLQLKTAVGGSSQATLTHDGTIGINDPTTSGVAAATGVTPAANDGWADFISDGTNWLYWGGSGAIASN